MFHPALINLRIHLSQATVSDSIELYIITSGIYNAIIFTRYGNCCGITICIERKQPPPLLIAAISLVSD